MIDIYIIIKQPKYFDLLLYLSYFVYAANVVPLNHSGLVNTMTL